ncbi:MAG: hypothetical protein D6744_11050 [Planctomycetota bacterium]|nr:MAG: hypothetical protein D6744_11050 [Planctomycetota bacterium]
MKKRMSFLAKRLIIAAVGTTPFFFYGASPSCMSNANVQTFYQSVGDAAIQSMANTTGAAVGNDGNNIIVQPASNFLQGLWDNWVDWHVPDDPTFGSPFRI